MMATEMVRRRPDIPPRALCVLAAHDVAAQLQGRERACIDLAEDVCRRIAAGEVRTPAAEPLQWPGNDAGRIVARAGWLGGPQACAGLAWASTMPGNAARGVPRGASLLVLNDPLTGHPIALMEGSLIASQRVATTAALAVRHLHPGTHIARLGLYGCGWAGREILRHILADARPVGEILLHDVNPAYARSLAESLRGGGFAGAISVARSRREMLASCDVQVFATSATRPSLDSLQRCPSPCTLLHVSRRDLSANALAQADNVVDDLDAARRGDGSLRRAAQLAGRADLVRTALPQVAAGLVPGRADDRPVVCHLFGLPALDLAIAADVLSRAREANAGTWIGEFLV